MFADLLRLDDLYSNLLSLDLVALWLLLLSFWVLGAIFFALAFLTVVAIIFLIHILISNFIFLIYVLEFLLPLILSYGNLLLLFLLLLLYQGVILVLWKQLLGLLLFDGTIDMLHDLLGIECSKFLFAKDFTEWLSTCFFANTIISHILLISATHISLIIILAFAQELGLARFDWIHNHASLHDTALYRKLPRLLLVTLIVLLMDRAEVIKALETKFIDCVVHLLSVF